MRKNYFAKKFVAYSMAFAVAFSTLTVSPVFVKEAKAATANCTANIQSTANAAGNAAQYGLENNTVLVESVVSSDATVVGATDIKAADFLEKIGLGNKSVRSVGITTGSNVTAADLSIADALGTVTDATVVTKANAYTLGNDIFAVSDNKGASLTTYTVAYSLDGKQNKDVVLDYDGTVGNTALSGKNVGWFKLTPHTGTYDVSKTTAGVTTTAKITYKYFTVDEVKTLGPDTTGDYDLGTLDESEFGYYVCAASVDESSDTYVTIEKVYNIVEKSDLTAVARKSTTYVKEGSDATLTVDTTSSKPVTYKWYKGTVELSNENNASLTVKNVKDNSGTYKCEVSDGIDTKYAYPEIKLLTKTLIDTEIGLKKVNEINTVKNVLVTNYLPNKVVSLTTSIPEGDYKYVWAFDGAPVTLSNASTLAYDSSNRSITITDTATPGPTNYSTHDVICYAIPTKVYNDNAGIKTALENLAKASDDITKFQAINALRTAEYGIIARAEFVENITLADKDAIGTSSVQVVKFGDTVTLEAPVIPGTLNTYNWKAVGTGATVRSTTNKLVIDTVDQKDLGTITCTINSCNKNHTHIATGIDACDTGKTTTAEFNLVYVSDLVATASDIAAKSNQKDVELKVNATSSLPITYAWQVKKVDGNGIAQNDATYNGTVNGNTKDSYKFATYPATAFYTGDKTEDSVYYVVTVSDGFKTIPVTIKATEINTFKVYEDNVKLNAGTEFTAASNIGALKGEKLTLAPIVVAASEDIEKELKFQWKKDGVDLSTDKSIEVEVTDTPVAYTLRVTEGTKTVDVTYNVSSVKEEDLQKVKANNINIYDFEEFMIYTGKELNPVKSVKATVNGKSYTLKEGIDYNVKLTDAVNAGISIFEIEYIGNFKDAYTGLPASSIDKESFTITRADNKVEIADSTVIAGKSVQPKTVTNLGKGALTYTYYADADCATEIAAPTKVGTYYVKATAAATMNYNEAESNVAKIVVAPATTKVTKVATNASTVKLTWTKVAGATKYRVFVKKSGKWAKVADTKSLTYTVKKLASATKYEFAVRAYAGSIASPKYVTKTAYTTPAKVATPAVKAGSKKATVSFKKVARATGYEIYMAKGTGKYVKVKTTTTNSFTKTGLTKGATYKFKVRAYKKVGSKVYYGAFSAVKAVKVK